MPGIRTTDFLRAIDWSTIVIYLIMVVLGWFTINAASYSFEPTSIFDFSRVSGKQFVWMLLALVIAGVIMGLDKKIFTTYAPVLYVGMILLLILTIFIAPDIKGSHSWLKIGSFSIQPAEFGKITTSLMLAWLFNTYNFKFLQFGNFLKACGIVLLPVALIIAQRETGSALVYFSLILLFYRQGMSGLVLFGGVTAVAIFVLGLRYSVDLESGEPSTLGQNIVMMMLSYIIAAMLSVYSRNKQEFWIALAVPTGAMLLTYLWRLIFPELIFPFRWVAWAVCAFDVLYCLWLYLGRKIREYIIIACFMLLGVGFLYSVNFAFNKLEDHQRVRIEVLLGMKDDLKGAGYNVNQAKIAIGSGGIIGKGYLEGTQTKLSYVPEQETDFIFCTVGEEEGFVGCVLLLALYATLIIRLVYLAERQRTVFAQVYGYCVASIFIFHVMINVGMVIGLCPVIGIPLPFFSYGGSGLWSFTILLFIFLKLDALRIENY
jgi:rod shape determining protein RodA